MGKKEGWETQAIRHGLARRGTGRARGREGGEGDGKGVEDKTNDSHMTSFSGTEDAGVSQSGLRISAGRARGSVSRPMLDPCHGRCRERRHGAEDKSLRLCWTLHAGQKRNTQGVQNRAVTGRNPHTQETAEHTQRATGHSRRRGMVV